MNTPWLFCVTGILFCGSGVYFFYKTIYEEDRKLVRCLALLVMGLLLIGIGTAKYFKLIP